MERRRLLVSSIKGDEEVVVTCGSCCGLVTSVHSWCTIGPQEKVKD